MKNLMAAIPLVLIHAFPLHQGMWKGQVQALEKNYRVLTLDVRGLGDSADHAPYTLENIVDDVIALLDREKIDQAVVGGLSMGGFVALRAVERNPERFRALILADTKSEPDSDNSKLGRYKGLQTIREKGLESFVDGFIRSSLAPSHQASDSAAFNAAKQVASKNTALGVEHALLALASRTDTTPGLKSIRIPTLILQGENDTVIPMAAAQALKEGIPGAKLAVIPEAGHLSNLDNPKVFNDRVLEFLTALPAAVAR